MLKLKNEYSTIYRFIEFIDDNDDFEKCHVSVLNLLTNKEKKLVVGSINGLSKNTDVISRNYISFDDAKIKVQSLGIKSFREYKKWHVRTKQVDLPSNPQRTYKEWVSYVDFFNIDPKSIMSSGEKRVLKYLEKNNIEYVQEKTFPDCENKKELRFDFYLPYYNMIIEFDGLQHHKPVDFFGGDVGMENLKKHDEIKNNYCSQNNIKILRLDYNDQHNNVVEWVLDIEFKRLNCEMAIL